MAIVREIDPDGKAAVLKYAGNDITPRLDLTDGKQVFEVLSILLDRAYNKLRDAGIEP